MTPATRRHDAGQVVIVPDTLNPTAVKMETEMVTGSASATSAATATTTTMAPPGIVENRPFYGVDDDPNCGAATSFCDRIDNNCDGVVDEAAPPRWRVELLRRAAAALAARVRWVQDLQHHLSDCQGANAAENELCSERPDDWTIALTRS